MEISRLHARSTNNAKCTWVQSCLTLTVSSYWSLSSQLSYSAPLCTLVLLRLNLNLHSSISTSSGLSNFLLALQLPLLIAAILLCGDIQLNPGHRMATSLLNSLYVRAISASVCPTITSLLCTTSLIHHLNLTAHNETSVNAFSSYTR